MLAEINSSPPVNVQDRMEFLGRREAGSAGLLERVLPRRCDINRSDRFLGSDAWSCPPRRNQSLAVAYSDKGIFAAIIDCLPA